MPQVTPFIWFRDKASEAVDFYVSVFPGARRLTPGTGQVITFELDGQRYHAFDGGPHFTLNEAFSLQIECGSQDEIDHYWERLGEGGEIQMCGWLKDRYGLSWQVIPEVLPRLLTDPDPERAQRATQAMLTMKKLDIAALQAAADAGSSQDQAPERQTTSSTEAITE